MKLTAKQLRQIIQEETENVSEFLDLATDMVGQAADIVGGIAGDPLDRMLDLHPNGQVLKVLLPAEERDRVKLAKAVTKRLPGVLPMLARSGSNRQRAEILANLYVDSMDEAGQYGFLAKTLGKPQATKIALTKVIEDKLNNPMRESKDIKLTPKQLRQIIQEELRLTEQSQEEIAAADAYIEEVMNELLVGLDWVASGKFEVGGYSHINNLNEFQREQLRFGVTEAFKKNESAFKNAVSDVVIEAPVGNPYSGDEEA